MTRKYILLGACALALSACADVGTDGAAPAQMTFAHLQAMRLNVRAVNVNATGANAKAEDFTVNPEKAAREYAARRFAAAGTQGTLDFTIEKAVALKKHEDSTNPVGAFLNVAGTDTYDVVLSVRIEHIDEGGRVLYGKVLTARRTINIGEHASLAERDDAQARAMEALFNDLDKEIHIAVLEDKGLVL